MDSEKVQVSVESIGFSVMESRQQPKVILSDVSACVAGGEMMCVLGPSGSGKTSLIHIVSQKIKSATKHNVSGTVLCNGQKLTSTHFQQISGLVTQEDVFNGTLTVQETLSFAAWLRLPAKSRSNRVTDVITMLGLQSCAHTKVGDDSNPYLKGISGGEKRRLAIASAILDPEISILMLDEPTSGLDAAAALNVVRLLRRLADAGMTVMTTLHQPRALIMQLFHKLLVLSQGRTIFYGKVDSYVPYLINDLRCEIPQHESPFDFLLDVLNPAMDQEIGAIGAIGALGNDCDNASRELADLYARQDFQWPARNSENALAELGGDSDRADKHAQLVNSRGRHAGWLTQFAAILVRTAVIKVRDPNAMMTQITMAIMMGVLIGAIYWDVYSKEFELAVMDVQAALTMNLVMVAFLPFDAVLTFPLERKIFLRERSAGLYCSSSFFLGRILADMPQHMLAAVCQCVIVYLMLGLKMDFASWILVHVIGILVGAAMMQMCGALSRTFEEGNIIVTFVMLLSMMVSEAFVRVVPSFLEWARHVSIMHILAGIGMRLEFDGVVEVPVITEDQMVADGFKLLALFLVCRIVTFAAVKFLHTARTCRENLYD